MVQAVTRADDSSLPDLQSEAEELRRKINRFRTSLGRFFVQKQEIIDLMVVAAIAQEPLLLVGPPGTAKSDLVIKFKDALGVSDDDYFEYMLTRFTEPSEIIGAIDIGKLRDGTYIRRKQGKLPTARIAFLDEIFKSNSRDPEHPAHDHQREEVLPGRNPGAGAVAQSSSPRPTKSPNRANSRH